MARTYTTTPAAVFAIVRRVISDDRADLEQRVDDASMLAALNEALQALVGLKPGLFEQTVPFSCADGATQTVDADRAVAVVDIPGLPAADRSTLDLYAPGWTGGVAGAAEEWFPLPASPLRFMVYPPAQAGQALELRCVIAPQDVAGVNDPIEVPESYAPALAEYVIGRIEMADDEHVNNGRAAVLLQRFAETVKAVPGG